MSIQTAAPAAVKPDKYVEPPTLESFQARAARLAPDMGAAFLVADLLTRVEVLEKALLPFGVHAFAMDDARMRIAAMAAKEGQDGRDAPGGGTWINGPVNATMSTNQEIFYNATDALGRQKVQDFLLGRLNAIKEAHEAQQARDALLAAGEAVIH